MVVAQMVEALARRDYVDAMAKARSWASAAQAGDLDAAIASCPLGLRARLYVLLSDVLSDYPTTRGGVPALFYWQLSSSAFDVEDTHYLALPVARDELDNDMPDAWLPADAPLPAPARLPTVRLMSDCLLAVVGVTTTVVPCPELQIPSPELYERLDHYQGSLLCVTGPSLPYPVAVLAVRAMVDGVMEAESSPLVRDVLGAQHQHYYALGQTFRADHLPRVI